MKRNIDSVTVNGHDLKLACSRLVSLLKVCAQNKDLEQGTTIHALVWRRGLLDQSSYVASSVVNMYAKCAALDKAQEVFDKLAVRDTVVWSTLIAGFVQHGQGEEAVHCFGGMQHEGCSPDAITYASMLKACGIIGMIEKGKQIHDMIESQGLLKKNAVLGNALVDMYARCGVFAKAQKVLDELPFRNTLSWNVLIAGYLQHEQAEGALKCSQWMEKEGFSSDAVTFSCILKACGSLKAMDKGKQIHDEIASQGLLGKNIVLGNALIDMYVKCGALANAQQVFDELPFRNVVSWSSLVAGFAQGGQGKEALNCFESMQREGHFPNLVALACMLKACGRMGAVGMGKQIHEKIVAQGLLKDDMVLGYALVDMYVKCGELAVARHALDELLFRDIIAWSALIAGYAEKGRGEEALECFKHIQQEGLSANIVTFITILKACGSVGAVTEGQEIHNEIVNKHHLGKDSVLGTALMDMYVKCGMLTKAQQVFDELPSCDVVSWSALIAGYAQQGQEDVALNYFARMLCEGLSPNTATFTSILKACGSIGAADKGRHIHDEIVSQGLLGKSTLLSNALVDMYAKWGALEEAQQLLDKLPVRDMIPWSSVINGYVHQGHAAQALSCLEQMQYEGISPDVITFTCMLSACNCSDLVDQNQMCLAKMRRNFDIVSYRKCLFCIVDVFCQAGQFVEAIGFLKRVSCFDVFLAWLALLKNCLKSGNVTLGRWAFERALQIDKHDVGAYLCMANIYADAGMKDDAKKIESMRLKNAG